MKKVITYATCKYQNSVLVVAYGVKEHGGIGIDVYPNLGKPAIQSGKIVSVLRRLIDELDLKVDKYDGTGVLKDTGLLGQHIIKAINESPHTLEGATP